MISDYRYLRQQDLVPLEKLNIPITVIGAGAIGSAAVVALAKMGCSNLTVWDDDLLEEVNIPNQLCRTDMVGKPKVEALAELTKNLTDTQIQTENRRYHGQRLLGLVVAAVDSMEGRQSV